ncbi:uncharacterized protein LOC110809479 isoform X2 [Carica papaya]|uniref:uncharacterized protein LOC110809479 isoform X2 n=1 Tax=Carica papaya TaxID=3649 RepID=UPI000B8CD8A9|nr:uncharacterized protein LOC110809479 isoform X2 [Carica papaya]
MGNFSRETDMEKLISYSNDLIEVLKDKKDINNLTQCLEHREVLQSSCDADFEEIQKSIEDYQRRISACKEKTEAAKSEFATDAETDHLQKELEEALDKERMLKEELRVITNEINDLDQQIIWIEERKQVLKKVNQQEFKEQRKLSMLASVTNIIPDLNDELEISGRILVLSFFFGGEKILWIGTKKCSRNLHLTQRR